MDSAAGLSAPQVARKFRGRHVLVCLLPTRSSAFCLFRKDPNKGFELPSRLPLSPAQQPPPAISTSSRPASRVERPTGELGPGQALEHTTRHSVSRLFKRKPDAASPPAASSSHEYVPPISSPLLAMASGEGVLPPRETHDIESASDSSRRLDVDVHSSSSRPHRHVASITGEFSTNSHATPSRDAGSEGRSRTGSFGG
ncbi:hypothetical protein JCM21900_006368 [Sporobolomyces salmonicolor]